MAASRQVSIDGLLGEDDSGRYLGFLDGERGRFTPGAAVREVTLVRYGTGPAACSASAALALSPEICHDVCGWYRRLGAHWRMSRAQLARAYLAGPQVPARSYALKMLLSPQVRRQYDRAPLGMPFLADRETQEQIKRRAAHLAARMSARTGREPGSLLDEILGDWGLELNRAGEEGGTGEDEGAGRPPAPGWGENWSFYLADGAEPDAGILDKWQRLLGEAFRMMRRGGQRFAVGIHPGAPHRIAGELSDGTPIIMTGTEPPTLGMAIRAAAEHIGSEKRKGADHG